MIKELAYHPTPLGELTLRVRPEPRLGLDEVYEVKLGDEFLMTSIFTDGEKELARRGLESLNGSLDVVVGGLGLGYTAAEALENENVASLLVVEKFPEVIGWHRDHLVPNGKALSEDSRCRFVEGDFFRLTESGFDPRQPGRKFDAVLLDIDHTPSHYLDPENESFYTTAGLTTIAAQIEAGGVLAIWSDDPPDPDFVDRLSTVFENPEGISVEFENPYRGGVSVNTVYRARRSA